MNCTYTLLTKNLILVPEILKVKALTVFLSASPNTLRFSFYYVECYLNLNIGLAIASKPLLINCKLLFSKRESIAKAKLPFSGSYNMSLRFKNQLIVFIEITLSTESRILDR